MRTRIALMAEPCTVCSKVLKEAYISTARKCRYDLLCLEKLKKEYEEVKSQLKT